MAAFKRWTELVEYPVASSANYKPAVADEGDYLRADVIASNQYGKATAASNTTAGVSTNAPVNSSLPTISGTPQRASRLTMTSKGAWSGPSLTYTYQWQRSTDATNWTNITGATKTTYTAVVADAGDFLRLHVIGKNVDGTLSAASEASALVNGLPPVNTAVPVVTGTAERAATLKATKGTWTGLGNTYSYQWQRCAPASAASGCAASDPSWANISGQTKTSYVLGVADEDTVVRCAVSATNPDAITTANSAAVGPVLANGPVSTSAPTVSGTPQRGQMLSETSKGVWSGAGKTYALQWQRSATGGTWANITGATAQLYGVQVADEGHQLRLAVTATEPGASTTAASAPTATVAGSPPVNISQPVLLPGDKRTQDIAVSGLSGNEWTGTGNTYSYQWQISSNGSTWTDLTTSDATLIVHQITQIR